MKVAVATVQYINATSEPSMNQQDHHRNHFSKAHTAQQLLREAWIRCIVSLGSELDIVNILRPNLGDPFSQNYRIHLAYP